MCEEIKKHLLYSKPVAKSNEIQEVHFLLNEFLVGAQFLPGILDAKNAVQVPYISAHE